MTDRKPRVENPPHNYDSGRHENTPPETRVASPLTPPPSVDRSQTANSSYTEALAFLRALAKHKIDFESDLVTFNIPRELFPGLQKALKLDPSVNNYLNDKTRFDYDPKTGRLAIRMPSAIHEFFVNAVSKRITDQLSTIGEGGGEAAEFATNITNGGSARIELDGDVSDVESEPQDKVRREPDAQFQHAKAPYAGVIVEVLFSQPGKAFKNLASDYIFGSDGEIKVVIGLDLNYSGKESTVSLWRAKISQENGEDTVEIVQEVDRQSFRSADGSPANPDAFLNLRLRDFATEEVSLSHENPELSISYRQLYDDLSHAESMKSARVPQRKRKRRKRKRTLPSSSPRRIKSDDEATYVEIEKRADQQTNDQDEDFVPPSNRRA